MIWLVAAALVFGMWRQSRALARLEERVLRLQRERIRPADGRDTTASDAPAARVADSGLEAAEPSEVQPAHPVIGIPVDDDVGAAAAAALEPGVIPAAALRAPSPPISISDWLAEHGLAWLGGGAVGLGGLLLVAYAANHGLFTPAFRIAAAALVGAVALGVGEILRRRAGEDDAATQRRVAALTTGAGAVILYGAAWAAHGLYGFIPASAAAGLLVAISAALLFLSGRHGEPLGLLSILGAYATPLVSGAGNWPAAGLDGFALLILTTGMAVSRRLAWRKVAILALVGAGAWALLRLADKDAIGAALLVVAAPLLTLRKLKPGSGATRDLTSPALIFGAALVMLIGASAAPFGYAAAALAAAAFAITAMLARDVRADALLAATPAAALLALAAEAAVGFGRGELAFLALPYLAVVGSALERPTTSARWSPALWSAAAAALALTIADGAILAAFRPLRGVIEGLAAGTLASAAAWSARRSPDRGADLILAAWVLAAIEAVGLTLHAATTGGGQAVAYGALAAGSALLALRLRWRGFAEAAPLSALAALAVLLGPALAGAALTGRAGPAVILSFFTATASLQAAAWLVLARRADASTSTEALSTITLVSGLLGLFLTLRAAGATGASQLDPFTEAALRSLLLLTAGLTLSARGGLTRLARARGPILLGLGALHAVLLQLLVLNPSWGTTVRVVGPPIADSLMLGLLAPGVLIALAASRSRETKVNIGLAMAALALIVGWELCEIRRLFHGPQLHGKPLGYAESAVYAAALLATSTALELSRAAGSVPARQLKTFGWVTSAVGVLVTCWVSSPWWGPLAGTLRQPWLLMAGYGLVITLTAAGSRQAAYDGASDLAAARRVGVVLSLFSALTLAIRLLFNGAAMRAPLREESLETWTFSVAWALLGLLVLAVAARRRDLALRWTGLTLLLVTTLKVFLFDLDRLGGVARAASFLALGVVLLSGALLARRLRPPTTARDDA